jgi:hypothetical protein
MKRKDSIVLSAFIFAVGCGAFCAVREAASANDTLFAQFVSGEGFSRGGSIDEIDYAPVDPEGITWSTYMAPVGKTFTVSTTIDWKSGLVNNPYGIAVYRTKDGTDFYFFSITAEGKSGFNRYAAKTGWQSVVPFQSSAHIAKGPNSLKITSDGATIRCYVNNSLALAYTPTYQLPDEAYVGFGAGNEALTFKDFSVSSAVSTPSESGPPSGDTAAAPRPAAPPGMRGYSFMLLRAKSYDYNGDGSISALELSRTEAAMQLVDRNNDGKISINELADEFSLGNVKISRGGLKASWE